MVFIVHHPAAGLGPNSALDIGFHQAHCRKYWNGKTI
jgi:hypothetical protein